MRWFKRFTPNEQGSSDGPTTKSDHDWIDVHQFVPDLPPPPYLLEQERRLGLLHGLRRAGFEIAEVDADAIRSERDLLTAIGDSLNFPDYYGRNWDAFYDCLGDIPSDSAPVAFLLVGIDGLMRANPYHFARSVHILCSACEELQTAPGPFMLKFFYLGHWQQVEERPPDHITSSGHP